MALSIYNSKWAPLQPLNSPAEMTNAGLVTPQQAVLLPELDMELLSFQDTSNLVYPDYPCCTSIDPLLFHDHQPSLHELNTSPYLAPLPLPQLDNSNIPPPRAFGYESYPKRQKFCQDEYYYYYYYYYPEEELMQSLEPCGGFVANAPLLVPEFSLPAEIYGPVVPASSDFRCGEEGGGLKRVAGGGGGGGGGSLSSTQSVAARQRRRKITEKTQELGKLIPGGHKMNTAEMFHAASKYLKFLQAQVGILELLGSAQENEGSISYTRELQALASSPSVQEKLCAAEKCLIPKQFVENLANHPELQSNSLISTELHQLIPSTSSG